MSRLIARAWLGLPKSIGDMSGLPSDGPLNSGHRGDVSNVPQAVIAGRAKMKKSLSDCFLKAAIRLNAIMRHNGCMSFPLGSLLNNKDGAASATANALYH